MIRSKHIAKLKSFLLQVAAGVLASTIFALITIPDQKLQLGSMALGVFSAPLFVVLGIISIVILSTYFIIGIIDMVLVKLDMIDIFDDFS